jgi:hypothetical protein
MIGGQENEHWARVVLLWCMIFVEFGRIGIIDSSAGPGTGRAG